MQENNFETIRNTWRRLSGEQIDSTFVSMSGDSPDNKLHKKNDEETDLLVSEKSKAPIAVATAGTAVVIPDALSDNSSAVIPEEKQEFIKHDRDERKEAAGDTIETGDKKEDEYLEDNDSVIGKTPENKWKKDKFDLEDKVDSVYLRPPPPHKTRSAASTADEEDCGIKCLYYTLQCFDCVLM